MKSSSSKIGFALQIGLIFLSSRIFASFDFYKPCTGSPARGGERAICLPSLDGVQPGINPRRLPADVGAIAGSSRMMEEGGSTRREHLPPLGHARPDSGMPSRPQGETRFARRLIDARQARAAVEEQTVQDLSETTSSDSLCSGRADECECQQFVDHCSDVGHPLAALPSFLSSCYRRDPETGKNILRALFQLSREEISNLSEKTNCPDKEERDTLFQKAYLKGIKKACTTLSKEKGSTIVFRRSGKPAEVYQFLGYSTKPKEVKNKSSTLRYIEGMIPINSQLGKIGDKDKRQLDKMEEETHATQSLQHSEKLLAHLKQKSPRTEQGSSGRGDSTTLGMKGMIDLLREGDTIKEQLEAQDSMMEELLKSRKYRAIPVSVQVGKTTKVVVYDDRNATALADPDPKMPNIAYVLADERGKIITADTDLFLIGTPLREPFTVTDDPEKGLLGSKDREIIHHFNDYWNGATGSGNIIIQHGSEAYFGLNPIDDELIGCEPEGGVVEFHLTRGNPDRQEELEKYAAWLCKQSQTNHIPVPSKATIEWNKSEMLKHGIPFDTTSVIQDYGTIWAYKINNPDKNCNFVAPWPPGFRPPSEHEGRKLPPLKGR